MLSGVKGMDGNSYFEQANPFSGHESAATPNSRRSLTRCRRWRWIARKCLNNAEKGLFNGL
jgi:hypothetical protein